MFGPVFSELQESPHIPKMNLHRLGINAAACLALLTAFVIDRAPVSAKGDKGLDGGPDAIPRGALARLGTDRFDRNGSGYREIGPQLLNQIFCLTSLGDFPAEYLF